MARETLSKDMFLLNIKPYKMEILLDQGVYRHVRFKIPDSWFDLVTGPRFLMIRGAMGCYVFQRLEDMFNFFRWDGVGPYVNLDYWEQKLVSSREVRLFSLEIFHEKVLKVVKDFIATGVLNENIVGRFESAVNNKIIYVGHKPEDLEQALDLLSRFEFNIGNGEFVNGDTLFGTDTWEWDLTEYGYGFEWCCHAIVWGIGEYDKVKGVV